MVTLKLGVVALLGKWCWRLLVDRGSLLYMVFLAQYGAVHGRLEDWGRSCSIWWREIVKIREGCGGGEGVGLRRWLRKVGDGADTLCLA